MIIPEGTKTEIEAILFESLGLGGPKEDLVQLLLSQMLKIIEAQITALPSSFKPGDACKLEFYAGGIINNCQVTAVHFTRAKVSYDIAILLMESTDEEMKDPGRWTVIENVDSVCVIK